MPERQQILQLWLSTAALDTNVVAWAFHDGTDGSGDPIPDKSPPYPRGIDALRDGWFLLQGPQERVPATDPVIAHQNSGLAFAFVFEKRFG